MDSGIFQMILILLLPQGMCSAKYIFPQSSTSWRSWRVYKLPIKNKDQPSFLVKTASSGKSCPGHCCLHPRVISTKLQRPLHTTRPKSDFNHQWRCASIDRLWLFGLTLTISSSVNSVLVALSFQFQGNSCCANMRGGVPGRWSFFAFLGGVDLGI